MSKQTRLFVTLGVVVVVIAAVWLGGGYAWDMLLRMHGRH
jgi:hypothetical protein